MERAGWWAGEEQLRVTHLDPPPSWHPGLALLSLWSLKNQEAHDTGHWEEEHWELQKGVIELIGGRPCVAGPCPSTFGDSASQSASGPEHPGLEGQGQCWLWNLTVSPLTLLPRAGPSPAPLPQRLWGLGSSLEGA